MNLLDEYKNGDVVGFSFSPIDYIEEKIMLDEHLNEPDQAPLHCMDRMPKYITRLKENGILEFDNKTVILTGEDLYDWILNENLNVQSVFISAEKSFVLKLHDHSSVWDATFYVNDEPVELSL